MYGQCPCENCLVMPSCSMPCLDFANYKQHLITLAEKLADERPSSYQGTMRTLEILKDELVWACRGSPDDTDLVELVHAFNLMYKMYSHILDRSVFR